MNSKRRGFLKMAVAGLGLAILPLRLLADFVRSEKARGSHQ